VVAIILIFANPRHGNEDSDTMDKLSAQSFEIVGAVVMESIHRLEH